MAAWPDATASAPVPPSMRGDALLENVGGRVHQARVDVAEFLQGEQIRGVVGALEDVGGRLVNRHGARAGGRIGDLAGVQRQRAETFCWCAHDLLFFRWLMILRKWPKAIAHCGKQRCEACDATGCLRILGWII